MGLPSCPENFALEDYARGDGAEQLRLNISAHLAICPRCRHIVANLVDDTRHVADPFQESEPEAFVLVGSHLGCDISLPDLADAETRLHPTREDVESRFDFRHLEKPREPSALGHLGKYTILEVLGYGGMGVVFRAHDEQLLRIVALKVMSRDLASSPTARRRFIREARAAAAINHPNVVTIHAVEEHNGTPFLVMEFIRGESLRERLRHGPRLGIVDVLRVSSQVASGLVAANAHGVIHRDIKPANIMLEEGMERVKITDFGLARVAVDNVDLTSRERGIGTPAYMSPEQVRGDEIDARSDLFALGCVMYTMLRGHSPFHGKSTLEIARRVADEDPEPPVADVAVPSFLSEVINRLLEKSPKKRYQSASEVAEILRQHLALINQTPTGKLGPLLQRSGALAARRSAAPWLAGSLAIVVIAVGIFGAWRMGWLPTSPRLSASSNVVPAAGSDHSPTPTAALSDKLSVSQSGPADCETIADALRRIASGGQITILDSAEYKENIRVNESARHAGVSLVALQHAKLHPSEQTAVSIRGVPKFRLSGLTIVVPQTQVAVEVSGSCPGVELTDLTIERLVPESGDLSGSSAALWFQGAAGTAEEPIVARRITFHSTNVGVVFGQAASGESPCSHIVVEECTVHGVSRQRSTLLVILRQCEDLTIERNIFANGLQGCSIVTTEIASPTRCNVRHNTWHNVQSWMVCTGVTPQRPALQVHHNLIVEAHAVNAQARALAARVSETPVFLNNAQANTTEMGAERFEPLATAVGVVPFRSLAADHPDYLKPDFVAWKAAGPIPNPVPGRYSESGP